MKKLFALMTLIVLFTVTTVLPAGAEQCYAISAKLTEDLATRSGPGTVFTGCGSYRMKGQTVTALSYAYDKGGVLWVEIEFTYGGAYRLTSGNPKTLEIW